MEPRAKMAAVCHVTGHFTRPHYSSLRRFGLKLWMLFRMLAADLRRQAAAVGVTMPFSPSMSPVGDRSASCYCHQNDDDNAKRVPVTNLCDILIGPFTVT